MKGMDLYYQERYNESLQAYDRAIDLDPTDYEAWNNRGIDLGIMGRYDEAIASFEQAVALNQSYAEAWYNMGVIYDFKGYTYTAVQAYKMATQINPEYQKAWERRNVGTDAVIARSLSCSCKDQIALVLKTGITARGLGPDFSQTSPPARTPSHPPAPCR